MDLLSLYLQQIINGIINGGTYALIAVGLTLVFGILNVVNFAHGEYLMMGGYVTLLFTVILGTNFWVALIGAMIIVGIISILIEQLVFRPIRFSDPMNNIIASMGLSILLVSLAEIILTSQPRPIEPPITEVIQFKGLVISFYQLILLVLTVILILGLTLFVKYTKIGNAMRAVAQDLTAAKLMGVNINKVAIITFALSGALTAAAGTLLAPQYLVSPHMGSALLLKAFAVVIFGGIGNVQGAIFAAFIIGISESLASQFIQTGYSELIAFIILITVLLFRPHGLFGVKTQ